MTKLYSRTFGISSLDQERDELLTQRMTALAFIQPNHLDIPEAYCNENSWVLAQRELLRINTYKAPRDKLVCILNCCRIINNLLHTGAAAGDGKGVGGWGGGHAHMHVVEWCVLHADVHIHT